MPVSHGPCKTRFCPSPTGYIHLGNARTALFNYLYAQSVGGYFLLRIEDTDVERSEQKYNDALQEDMRWMKLIWSEGPEADMGNGPYHQSKRQAVYDDYYQRLEKMKLVYPCFCSQEQLALTRKIQRSAGQPPRYNGACRALTEEEVQAKLDQGLKPTLRFRLPDDQEIVFTDSVRGEQKFNTNDIGDFIIRRANGTAPFMYCNAIDDALMGVTHALRGEDHLTNTPRQVLILKALGLPVPTYGHISLILGSNGGPLSKRHGSRSIRELRETGYLPLAVNNYLARLGHYYSNEAFMSLAELSAQFQMESLSKSPARFNQQQLDYWQKAAVSRLSAEEFWQWVGHGVQSLVPEDKQSLFVETVQPNVAFPHQALAWAKVCFSNEDLDLDAHQPVLQTAGAIFFKTAQQAYEHSQADYQQMTQNIKEKLNVKGKLLFQPLRIALTGQLHGPELDKLLHLLGPALTKQRLLAAEAFAAKNI